MTIFLCPASAVTRNVGLALLLVLVMVGFTPSPACAQPDTVPPVVGLHPGDVVRVTIWREPDLGGEFVVDANGVLTLPMIGEQEVTGLTPEALRQRLVERYRVNLRNPSIVVTPLRRVHVLGAVNRPGSFLLDPTTTLAGAIAQAMGANPQGDLGRIRIVRDDAVLVTGVSPDHTLSSVDVRSGDQIFVGEKSWFARNSPTLIAAALPTAIATVIAVLRR